MIRERIVCKKIGPRLNLCTNMRYDVAIIGGGPAGSTAATTLARGGRSVIVLEREKFPRFHIGESLLPYSMDAFDRLGLREKMEQAGFMPKYGAEIASGCGTCEVRFHFKNGFKSKRESAYQVTRADFDKLLLDHAREQGADVFEETQVTGIEFFDTGVRLRAKGEDCPAEIEADYVIDASGRNSLVGNYFGLKKAYHDLKKFAVYAHYEGVDRAEGIDGTLTRMVRTSKSWFWMIPLSETKMSIGLVMNLDEYKARGLSPESILNEAIAEQPVMQEKMRHATRISPVHGTGDYSYRNEKFTGDRWMLAGDAAGFIDPVFSSGVFLAILTGEQSGDAILGALRNPKLRPRLFTEYHRKINRVMDLYLDLVLGWYRQEFIETFFNPTQHLQMVPAINAILAGNDGRSFAIRWRMSLFRFIVRLQKRFPLSPKLTLEPKVA